MTSYVGLDVSLAETSVCVLSGDGKVRYEGKVRSLPDELIACIRKHAVDAERVAIETGQTSALLFRAMEAADLPVVCIERPSPGYGAPDTEHRIDRKPRIAWHSDDQPSPYVSG